MGIPINSPKLPLFTVYLDGNSGQVGIDVHDPNCHPPTIVVDLLKGMIQRYEKILGQSVILSGEADGLTRT